MSWVDEYFEKNVKDIRSFIKYKYSSASSEDIADIAHDTYLQLKAAEPRIGDITNQRSYIYTSLQRASVNFFRGVYKNNRIDKAVALGVCYSPLQTIAVKQMFSKAMDKINTLPEQQRKAILAKANTDSTEEFNALMSCGPESAKHHYFLARKKMLDFSKNFEYSYEESYVEDVHGFIINQEEDT